MAVFAALSSAHACILSTAEVLVLISLLLLLCSVEMLSGLQDALDDLTQHLTTLESELRRHKSVADLLVSDLQSNIDNTLARCRLILSVILHHSLECIVRV